MGECKVGLYKDNSIVLHGDLMCFGGFGQPQCAHLDNCAKENGLVFRKGKWRLPTIRELKRMESERQ